MAEQHSWDGVLKLVREAFEAGYQHAATGFTSPEEGFMEWSNSHSQTIKAFAPAKAAPGDRHDHD